MKLWLDLETYSGDDLKEVGTYVYAENAEILLFAYAVDEGPVAVWDCTSEDAPSELLSALHDATEVWAANAQFDKAILAGPAGAHLPRIELTRWRCSMAQALSHALPASLGDLCTVLKVPEDQAKNKEGKKLIATSLAEKLHKKVNYNGRYIENIAVIQYECHNIANALLEGED